MDLDPVLIGRWQFGITTVYHFWMVPLTLGLGMLVAILQTMYHRTGNEVYLRKDQVLREALPHQLHHGCGDRPGPRVSVRYGLE